MRRAHNGEPIAFIYEAVQRAKEGEQVCIRWPFSLCQGYGQIIIDGRMWRASRAALHLTEQPESSELHAAHGLCHDRRCVNPNHLSWKTRVENEADKLRDGALARGERQGGAKLTSADVRVIRCRLSDGETQAGLAADFGVTQECISKIRTGKNWGWLDG